MANLARGEADIALRNRLPDHNSLVVRRLGTAGLAFFASRTWIARNGVPAGGLAGCDVILPAESAMRLPMFAKAAGVAEHSHLVLRTGDMPTSMAAAVADLVPQPSSALSPLLRRAEMTVEGDFVVLICVASH